MSYSRSLPPYRAATPPYVESNDEAKPLTDEVQYEYDNPDKEILLLRKKLRRTKLTLRILVGLLSATVLASIFIHYLSPQGWWSLYDNDGDPLTPVPEIPRRTVIFQADKLYGDRSNEQSDAAWDTLLPPGRGFVVVDDPQRKYGLPVGEQTKNGQIYSIALYHQIHCLGQIRKYTWLLAEAVVMNDTEAAELMRYHIGEGDGADHINHCFDYLRQSITCAGDMTLEWPRLEANGDRFVVEGWGVPHQCKDPAAIKKYMDANYFTDSVVTNIAPN